MKVAIAADHAGFELKGLLAPRLRERGHELLDLGTHDTQPVDYPDFAEAIGRALREQRAERGIIVCGSGVGVSVAANKIPGVRAGLCHDHYSAHQGVEHDDMNVLCMGARVVGAEVAVELAEAFLAARFTGEERHTRRLAKVLAMERKYSKQG
jgi:RpiB/LacA/LacB family sugar-phosphate isomerase